MTTRHDTLDERIDAWVEKELAEPDAQGPLTPEAERVITALLADRRDSAA